MELRCDDAAATVWRIQLFAKDQREIVISAEGLGQLLELLARAELSDSCRAIVLEGSDGGFCKGMDLDAVGSASEDTTAAGLQLYADCLCALRGSSKVVIAAVDGEALAGGLGLAAASDLIIATERSVFGLPEVMLGLLPAMVLPTLLERMAPQKVRRLALSVSSIDAAEAQRIGLVDRLAADASELERALRAELKDLLRVEPGAMAALKRLTGKLATEPFADAVATGRDATAERLARPEIRAAIESFLAGEPLPWFARYRAPAR